MTAGAKVKVAEADERKARAMLEYTKLTAPYDGVVTVRNANTGDYVQGVTGDKSTPNPSAIFVVARMDMVRIFVDVPEAYARYVREGNPAVVRAEALCGVQIPATVTRTSWAIHEKTRTLLTEIDLPVSNTTVSARECTSTPKCSSSGPTSTPCRSRPWDLRQPNLLLSARGKKAIMTAVAPGLSDGTWTEVDQMKLDGSWKKVTGDENVVMGDVNQLADGQTVSVAAATSPSPP